MIMKKHKRHYRRNPDNTLWWVAGAAVAAGAIWYFTRPAKKTTPAPAPAPLPSAGQLTDLTPEQRAQIEKVWADPQVPANCKELIVGLAMPFSQYNRAQRECLAGNKNSCDQVKQIEGVIHTFSQKIQSSGCAKYMPEAG